MKRILSFLLSVAMLISMLPAGAFAAELETAPVVEPQAVTEAATEQGTEAAETAAAETLAETAAVETAEETEAAQTVAQTVPETTEAVAEETVAEEAVAEETVAEEAVATVEDDFRAAIAAAEASGENYTVWDEVILTEDLTVNMAGELSFADYSKLVVPSGVTLTLNCPTIINGATLVVEAGGKLVSNVNLTVVAPLNPATFDMNGEFVNNGILWIDENAVVNINGIAISYYQPIHVGFGVGGTLNVNGTLTSYGYFNVNDTLNVNGTLILEKNENGNAYLQGGGTINVSGTMDSRAAVTIGNDAGTAVLTVAQGGVVTVAEDSMWFDIVGGSLVNNGTLTNNFYHIGNYGTLTNNGTLNNPAKIRNYGSYTNNGTVSGNAPVDGVADAWNMFLDGIASAQASGENYTVWDEVILTEDLTVNMAGELSFADYSKLVVPSGVTLTLNCPTVINGATLVVEEGGKLVSNVNLSIVAPMNPATFDMEGEFVNSGSLWVNEGATVNLGGTANSTGPIFVGFGGNGATSTLNIDGTLSTSGYLCISDSGAPGLLKVNSGAVLNILNNDNGCGYLDVTCRADLRGTVNLDGMFTTGAAKDDDGNVVGKDAFTEIWGTVIGSEKSSIGVLPKGAVNVFGSLVTDGEVSVEPQGALWVDSTVTLNGPLFADGWVHVDYVDDVTGAGVLNLNGVTNATGYLAVHEGGTLNTGADSELNILNNADGCGYLDNQGTVNLSGKMTLDGLFTTGAAQDDYGNVVGPDAYATNNGTIEASADSVLGVYVGGIMTNNGTVTVAGEYTMDGTWLGNAAEVNEKTMSFADFKAALAAGSVELREKVTVEENLTVDHWMYIYEGGELIVPEGVTLTVKSAITIYGGKLTVEAGGSLVNNSHLYVEENGTLEVAGTYSAEKYNYLFVRHGASTVTGVDMSMITLRCDADTEAMLREAANMTGYKKVDIQIRQNIRLSEDLTLHSGLDVQVYGGAELTVSSGVTLNVDGSLYVFDAGISVESGGTVRVSRSGYLQVQSGYLRSAGTVETEPQRIHVNLSNGVEITGVDTSLVSATYLVGSVAELTAAIALCSSYGFMEIEPYATITLESDLTIPANSMFAMYDNSELVQLIIPQGVTVTNCGSMVVNYNCQIWIQEGGTLDNRGGLSLNHENALILDGTLLGNSSGGGGGGGDSSRVDTMEGLKAAVAAEKQWIEVGGSITLTEDVTLSQASSLNIYEGGEIIIPNGVTLTVPYGMSVYDGKLTVEAGGTLIVSNLYVDGTFTVDPKATFTVTDNGGLSVRYGSTVTGVAKETYTMHFYADTEAQLRTGTGMTGYSWTVVYLCKDMTLTQNLTIAETVSLMIEQNWVNGQQIPATLTVPSGKTITNNGSLVTMEGYGSLVIEQGAKVVNNTYFYSRGTLVNNGEIVNNGDMYVYGDMTGDGVITGEGFLDYARPAYSHADIVAWLNADKVPTFIYVWGEVTLEGDITIPEGTQLIMEGSTLIVPSGVTVTVNGELYSQEGGVVTFQPGSKLVNNNWVEAYHGTINIYGDYEEAHEDIILMLNPDSAINGVDNRYIYYMVSFTDEASLVAALNKVAQEGYGEATVYVKFRQGVVEVYGDVTVPENAYLMMGNYYGDSMVLKSGAVLTNYGEIYVTAPGTLTIEDGAQLINHGALNADDGCVIYLGGGISLTAETDAIYGKGKVNLSAVITPETMSGAKITWALAEGHELYATLKASGSKATLTAADVTGLQSVRVIASATLDSGETVSDYVDISIVPLMKQIFLLREGEDVTGQTLTFDLNRIPEGQTQPQRTLDLTARIAPEGADPELTWTTSDASVATVADGKVTFTDKGGKVTITAAATDGSKVSDQVTIEAVKLAQAITLLEGESELVGGKGTNLKVQDAANPGTALPASAVTWALADEADAAYVTVTAAGKVTTKAVPERIQVTLLGTINDNPEAQPIAHTITVYPAVTLVEIRNFGQSVSGQTLKLDYSGVLTLSAAQYPADSMGDVTWEVSDKTGKFVTYEVNEGDLILKPTGVKGNVTVKAVATDGSKKNASVKLQLAKYVSSISVSAPQAELISGQSMVLTANVQPADAANKAVVWSLAEETDKQFVSVSSSGKVTAKKNLLMSKDITVLAVAKDGSGAIGSVTFRLQPADPGALVILGEEGNVTGTTLRVNLLNGGAVQMKAKYLNTDSADVTWSGKGVTFTEEDENGFVTATVSAKGTFTVTAEDASGKKATVKLAAANLSEGVQITGGSEVASGKTLQLSATVQPAGYVADKKVTWWIDGADMAYAKISSSGKLTAAKNLAEERTIRVWAQAKDGASDPASVLVTIQPQAQAVQILLDNTDITNTTVSWDLTTENGKLNLAAEVFPADAGQMASWKISGAKVVEKTEGGWSFTGKTGTATITATAADGSGKKASFKLTVLKTMAFLSQSQNAAIIAGGKSLKLASFVTVDADATNKKLNWSMTGDTEVATLSAAGVLKTKKVTDVKTVTVTAEAADGSGCKAEFLVEIYPATTSVKLLCDGEAAPKQAALGVGETLTLEGISLPSTAAQGPGAYSWKLSSDKFVSLTENPDGTVTVTGKAAGTVTVTCTAADGTGKKATVKIKVG